MLTYLIQTSIFRYSKNYGSLTHETRIKDSVNMEDLICLLATVRTLKHLAPSSKISHIFKFGSSAVQLTVAQILVHKPSKKINYLYLTFHKKTWKTKIQKQKNKTKQNKKKKQFFSPLSWHSALKHFHQKGETECPCPPPPPRNNKACWKQMLWGKNTTP